ncbi:MAG: dockerin type I repeat-containing protein, partial [Spirochaetales bacterium]|nr:dockerin type I repeat-containing protein [Spirochaetales bacterium]
GTYQPDKDVILKEAYTTEMKIADMDKDSYKDLLIITKDGYDSRLYFQVWYNRSNAHYTPGDVNEDGLIDITDALLIAQYFVNLNPRQFTAPLKAGDVNNDGIIDIVDALLVAQFYVGIIDEF